jgi:hypothetical protein
MFMYLHQQSVQYLMRLINSKHDAVVLSSVLCMDTADGDWLMKRHCLRLVCNTNAYYHDALSPGLWYSRHDASSTAGWSIQIDRPLTCSHRSA